jgi:hypothetical protein
VQGKAFTKRGQCFDRTPKLIVEAIQAASVEGDAMLHATEIWLGLAGTSLQRTGWQSVGDRGDGQDLVAAAENSWFEYSFGSTLLNFCFPVCCRSLALAGVKVLYKENGPTSKREQPLVGVEEKEVLQNKIQKLINRRYLAPILTKFKSLIKYFAVPKGVISNIIQNRRVVIHAGAKKLNGCVWAPLLCLPSISSLERIVNKLTLMLD